MSAFILSRTFFRNGLIAVFGVQLLTRQRTPTVPFAAFTSLTGS